MPTLPPIDRHNDEIQENLRHWTRKPLLRKQYARFYREIAIALTGAPVGPILECGSGIGNIKSVIPEAITSDLFPNPWLDRQENVYAINMENASLGAVVLFDVFHHLQYPGTALKEIHRVLKSDGRLIIFEPSMGLLGRLTLGLFHHEPLGLNEKIEWEAPLNFEPHQTDYYAAQGNAWRIFARSCNLIPQTSWKRKETYFYIALGWILSGGFRGPKICPQIVAKALDLFEYTPFQFRKIMSSRMLISICKAPKTDWKTPD